MFKNGVKTSILLVLASALIFYSLLNMNVFNIQYRISIMNIAENIFMIGAGYFIVFFVTLGIHGFIKNIGA